MHLLALIVALVANAGANILIKAASKAHEGDASLLAQILDLRFCAGVAAFGLALAGYSVALKHFDLSLGYPIMTGGGLILVTLASFYLFREPLTLMRLAGIAAILIGVVLISSSANPATPTP